LAWAVAATGFPTEPITLFSRGYLLSQREVAENSGFNRVMGDSQGLCGANPEFSATAKSGGISFEIPLSKRLMASFWILEKWQENYSHGNSSKHY
jgi:hypothetical protein